MKRDLYAFVLAACSTVATAGCDRTPGQQVPAPGQQVPAPGQQVPAPGQQVPASGPLELSASARRGTSADGTYVVRWEVAVGKIPDAEPFSIAFAVTRADGAPLAADAEVFVDAEMPQHGHGMNLVPTVERRGGDTFIAQGLLFHMPGRWVLAIDVGEGGVRERTQWEVDVE